MTSHPTIMTLPALLSRLALVVLLLSVPLLVAAQTEVSFQAHSYNDLRQWPSLILKGALWIKVDFNYGTPSFCQTNATATSRVRDGSHGCFLLNHDPLSLARTSGYNTSDDVLDLVEALSSTPWLHGPRNVSIALCHKFDGNVCANTSDAINWRSLMQAFYTRAESLIARYQLSIIFVEDGAGAVDVPSACLTDLFPGWPSTYIPSDNTRDGLFRNDTPTYARMNLLNMEASSFYNVSAERYGKFPPSPYPYLLWEPSDQRTLLNFTQHYMLSLRHQQGFRFAINIDPAQWAVYTGEATQEAWNIRPVALQGRTSASHATLTYTGTPYLAVLSSKAAGGSGDDGYNVNIYRFGGLLRAFGLPWVTTGPLTLPRNVTGVVDAFIVPSWTPAMGTTQQLFVSVRSAESTSWVLYPMPGLSSWFVMKSTFVHSFVHGLGPAEPTAHDVAWQSPDSLLVVRASGSPTVSLSAYVINVTGGETQLLDTVLVPFSSDDVDITGLAVAVAPGPYHTSSACAAGAVEGALSITLSNYTAFIAYLCITVVIQLSPVVPIDVGSTPSLSIERSPSSSAPHFLLTLSTSYCYNTEVYNKQADSGLCDHSPIPMASTLTYSFGLVSSLQRFVDRRAQGVGGGLICNAEFLHGTYDMGSRQSARLWRGFNGSGVELLGVVEVHDGVPTAGEEVQAGVNELELVPSTICGPALPWDGVVVDAWPLPQQTTWEVEDSEGSDPLSSARSAPRLAPEAAMPHHVMEA